MIEEVATRHRCYEHGDMDGTPCGEALCEGDEFYRGICQRPQGEASIFIVIMEETFEGQLGRKEHANPYDGGTHIDGIDGCHIEGEGKKHHDGHEKEQADDALSRIEETAL